MCDGIARLHVPVIAALPGPAIGGGAELAVACDLRVADPSARLSFKHARMAVTTAWGLLPKMVTMVGHATASRLLILGHELDAQEALRVGLVDAVSGEGRALDAALAWAGDVAGGAPRAIASIKALLRDALAVRGAHRRLEQRRFVEAWASADHHEAVEAFFGGRASVWTPALSGAPARTWPA